MWTNFVPVLLICKPFIVTHSVQMRPPAKLKRTKQLPPGQRLIRYLELAFVVTFLQGQFLPFDQLNKPSLARSREVKISPPFDLLQRQQELENRVRTLATADGMRVGVFAIEPKSGRYVDVAGTDQFAAASIIKLPVLVSFLAACDHGVIKLDDKLTISQELVTGGSGHLQWRPIGSKVTAREAAELMIVVSDNTATNLLINALGGKEKLNQEFNSWGLGQTKINNLLGDFTGTNKTSPSDLVYLLGRIDRGELLSPLSRNWMLAVLERTKIRTLLPPGLGPGAKIAHKTGDIGTMIGDAGIVTTAQGIRYLIAVQVERPHNDRRANEIVRNISKEIYQCISLPAPLIAK